MKFKAINRNNIMLIIVGILIIISFIIGHMTSVRADESRSYDKSFTTIAIEEGTTLTDIAMEYAVSEADYSDYIAEVKEINNLNQDTIHAGCYLLIPVYREY